MIAARVGLVVLAGALLVPTTAAAQSVLRVAADGSAEHDTITAAIEAAAPGDTILIAPGEYAENLVIAKPVTLRGEGDRDDVIIIPGEELPQRRDVPDDDEPVVAHVFVDGVDVRIVNLVLGEGDRVHSSLMLAGGSHVIRDIAAAHFVSGYGKTNATIEGSDLGRVVVMGPDAHLTVRDSTIGDAMTVGMGASAVVQDNLIVDWPIDVFEDSSLEATGNTFRPTDGAPAIWVSWAGASATVIDNHIEGARQGVVVEHGASAHIEGNTIIDPAIGILVIETGGVVRDNTITDAREAGIVVAGNGTVVEDNTVTGGRIGINVAVPNGYPPGAPRWDEPSTFTGNVVTGASHYGIHVDAASPVLSGNTICAERQPLKLRSEATPQLGANEICEVDG